jgi:hypothetical protein
MLFDVLKGIFVLELSLMNHSFCNFEKPVLLFCPEYKVQKDLKVLHGGQVKIFKSSILFGFYNNSEI